MGAAKPSPGPCANVDSVCRKYGLQLLSPQCLQPEKAPLERLPTRSSLLVQLYTKLPTSSIQMYKINAPILGSCWCISIKAYSPCDLSFFVHVSVLSSFPHCSSQDNHTAIWVLTCSLRKTILNATSTVQQELQ